MDNQELYRQIILDHYNNPQNKASECPKGYETYTGVNPSCGDELEIYIKVLANDKLDIKFNGKGCSICCSSASVMCNELKQMNKKEAQEKIENFKELIQNKDADIQNFEDAIAFSGISKFPARFKCAFLAWQTANDALFKK